MPNLVVWNVKIDLNILAINLAIFLRIRHFLNINLRPLEGIVVKLYANPEQVQRSTYQEKDLNGEIELQLDYFFKINLS